MGGDIRVQSQPNMGTVFTVIIPLRHALETPEAKLPTAQLQGKQVLLVDDNATNAKILESHLADFGMYTRIARSSADALAILLHSADTGMFYDIALLDMKMSGMNGAELTQRIRSDARFAELRIVIISSSSDEEVLSTIRSCACDLFLLKPLHRRALQDALLDLSSRKPHAVTHITSANVKILLAEDNPVNQKVCSAMLNQLGYSLLLATNGQEVLDILNSEPIDLILMDCMMPVMDGYTATRHIRAAESATGAMRIPIIALTANVIEGDRELCLQAGMDDYLSKPFLQKSLQEKIRTFVNVPTLQPVAIADVDLSPRMDKFDPTPLNTLRQIGGDALVDNVLSLFRSNAEQYIAKLAIDLQNQDTDAVRLSAHTLKSAAANIGAVYLAELARNLEKAARADTLQFDAQLAENLQSEYKQILQRLSQLQLDNESLT